MPSDYKDLVAALRQKYPADRDFMAAADAIEELADELYEVIKASAEKSCETCIHDADSYACLMCTIEDDKWEWRGVREEAEGR